MSYNLSIIEDADALLIQKIRETSILYNNHYADFRHSNKKDKAWDEVANSLGISKSDAKRRWTCLRDRYSRELKEVRSKCPRKENCGTGEFFQIMDFLRPFVRKRRPNKSKLTKMLKTECDAKKVKMQDVETDYQSEECTQDQYEKEPSDDYSFMPCDYAIEETYEEFTGVQDNTPVELSANNNQIQKNVKSSLIMFPSDPIGATTIHSQQQQKREPIQQMNSQTSIITQPIECSESRQQCQQPENEDDFFCKSVAIYLRKLSRLHKIKAKVEIFQILEKYIEIEENCPLVSN